MLGHILMKEEPEGGGEEPLDQRREEDQREGDPDDGVHDTRRLARVGQRVDVAVTCISGTRASNEPSRRLRGVYNHGEGPY